MKIALCCIAKMENEYIREFIEYYINLGIDKIFLYDNNSLNGERFDDVIKDFIEQEIVEVIDYRERKVCQKKAYEECYLKHQSEFDWMCFFDCDEFLTLVKDESIKDYLSREEFNKYQMIHINWMCYGDNNLLGIENNNERSVLKRFTEPLPFTTKGYDFSYKGLENNHIKTIVRCGTEISWIKSWNPHTPKCNIDKYSCCNNKGERCPINSPYVKYNFENAYLRHFMTKTVLEYCHKIIRGYADQPTSLAKKHLTLKRFFTVNSWSSEKEKVVKDFLASKKGTNQ